jgi:hypothetical protein
MYHAKTPTLMAGAALLVTAGIAAAQARPPSVTPYEGLEPLLMDFWSIPGSGWVPIDGFGPGVQAAADHIISQQCTSGTAAGGFCWEHGSACCTGTPPGNITAPICLGLLKAYDITQDTDTLDAAIAGGDYDVNYYQYGNGESRFGSSTPYFLYILSGADYADDSTYSDHAAVNFFDALTAGSYGPSDYDTAGYIAAVQAGRTGPWINIRSWDFSLNVFTSATIGNAGQDTLFEDALLDGLDTLDDDASTTYYDTLGIAGAVRGLALAGTTSFPAINSPNHAGIDGIDNLCDLADVLAGYQNSDGSWYWHSNLPSPTTGDKSTQVTSYCVLALIAAEAHACGPYDIEIARGRSWLDGMQDTDGGFFSWPDSPDHNTEVEGEALSAMAIAGLSLDTSTCATTSTIIVEINMDDMPTEVVGGQFFLEYDDSILTLVSVDPGDAPFTVEVFECSTVQSVPPGCTPTVGQIDYAVGVVGIGPGTSAATTMARIEFSVSTEPCTVADLVTFRDHDPPTRLTDNLGTPVYPTWFNVEPVTIDGTAPVFDYACPPINVNSDAGTCEAAGTTVNPVVQTATDNCDPSPSVTFVRSDGKPNLSDAYEAAHSPISIEWTATDACGNSDTCTQVVTVNAVNDMDVNVELAGVSASMTRCITFELWDCPASAPLEIVERTLSFTSGAYTGTVEIPCGLYDCITARDRLHTLRRTDDDGDFAIVGTKYEADFTSTGASDDSLIGGNLNDDIYIDILDFGVFVGEFNEDYGTGNTDCNTGFPHADISGDGLVNSGDYTYIQQKFLEFAESDCCAPLMMSAWGAPIPGTFPGPVTRISVEELRRRGLHDLVVADLNGDGWLDVRDMVAFANGARP